MVGLVMVASLGLLVPLGEAGNALPTSSSLAATSGRQIAVPAVNLVREDGRKVDFRAELDDGRPVYLNFIFTSCQGICPASSQVFSQLQQRLKKSGAKAHLVSVSLDPDYDTPARLREYAARFHAGKGWHHYTGTVADSVAVQKAFGAWRGDKMNHEPVTFFRLKPGAPWERIEGFATAADLHGRLPQQ